MEIGGIFFRKGTSKVITSKWVFKCKHNGENQTPTYKARLIARGCSQAYHEDYDETFAPVVKHETIRALLRFR